MLQTAITIGVLAGGLGLFLLAVSMITEGLKSAAGTALRNILSSWTRSPIHGIFTGLAITAIVQSSSAVTVATIGFVNAGLISMRQALGIVYGSNIGTTMTGWLVAIIGFKINVEAFALPIVGLGMLLRLTGGESRRAPLGMALVGFGLFFIGIDVLKDAFDGLVLAIDLHKLTVEGTLGVLMYLGIGFLMTVLTQSSSAAIAITLTAATGGVLSIYAAAAMVIGANVGTTSTAGLAVIGATANARRVACAHILFNVGTGFVALLTLPLLFWIVTTTGELLGLESIPAVTLALFHTVFNILGVLLIFPLNDRLASFLEKRFVSREEVESRPQFLDKTVLVSPVLAVHALELELSRILEIARRMGLDALSSEISHSRSIVSDSTIVRVLSATVAEFVAQVGRGEISKDTSEQLTTVLRAQQHLLACADESLLFAGAQANIRGTGDALATAAISRFKAHAANFVEMADPEDAEFSLSGCEHELQQLQLEYDEVKAALLLAGAESRVPMDEIIGLLDQNSRVRELARHLVKALRYLNELSMKNAVREKEPEPQQEPEPQTEVEA